ncbi:MAG: iron-siderophore ABC transporter substrate-binding protein [Lachnospiraceae bacterium]|nr:iron-siderophore ABC transporter substrate-binding protein [Lachnospiraceae bacterium]
MRVKNLLNAVIPMALAVALVTGCGAKNGESANSAVSKTANVTSSAKSSSTASKDRKTSTTSSSTSMGGASSTATASFPITMKHAYGETVIKSKPERVVTLDWNNADAVLALGIVPVGTARANWGPVTDKGLLPWTEEKFKELGVDNPNVFNDLEGYDYEAVAAAKPDIIVAPYSGMDEKAYKRLSEIAPTLPFRETAWKTTWREQTEEAAEALGLKSEGEKLVSDTDAFIKETLVKYPNLAGKSVAMCYINAADLSSFSVYRTADPRGAYLTDLGFTFPKKVEAQAKDKNAFYVQISSELAVDALSDTDIIITYGDDKTVAALKKDAIFSKIPAVKEGRVVVLDSNGNLAASCNPSVLSIKAELVNYLDAINAVVK